MSFSYIYETEVDDRKQGYFYGEDGRDDRLLISVLRATRTPYELEDLARRLMEVAREMRES